MKTNSIKDLSHLPESVIITSRGVASRSSLLSIPEKNIFVFDGVSPNTKLTEVKICLDKIKKLKYKNIIGIGGGSVLDFAKLIATIDSIPEHGIRSQIENNRVLKSRDKTLFLIPTLFGSGAEQTPFAVCYISEKKYSVSSQAMIADKVIYDQELINSIPQKIRLANILDCFCQAFESMTTAKANSVSIVYSKKAIQLLINSAPDYTAGNNSQSEDIMLASEYSGKAIAITKTTGPHAFSYYLTSKLQLPHGIAVASVFVIFFKLYNQFYRNNVKIDLALEFLSIEFKSSYTNESLYAFFKDCGLNIDKVFKEIIAKIDFKDWFKNVNLERLNNGPEMKTEYLNYLAFKNYFVDFAEQ